ncbi:hypothetical protein ATX59_07460 [Oenococcus oeni]|uniref:Polysaccharide polymerase n=1 Tax=Oenococcus oeni TaxID=1247 RepID=A0A6N4A0M8_OENOE|nr:hypothetical protein ATX59_07460 [Oenococcus oeni]
MGAFFLPKTPKQLVFWIIGIFLIVLDYRENNGLTLISKLLAIGLAVGALRISFQQVLKAYLLSTTIGTCIIMVLSFVGYLPIVGQQTSVLFSSYQNIVFCFGFIHPNAFGTALFSITISFLFLYSKKYKKTSILLVFCAIFIDFLVGAQTAAVGVIIFGIGTSINHYKHFSSLEKAFRFAYIIPIFLAFFAIFLARHPGSSLYDWFNQHIASRPSLWNYYLINYPPHKFGNSINIDLSAVSNIYGNGVLDGSYIYYLLHFGYAGLIILLLIMLSINQKTFLTKNALYGLAFIATCCVAFPETNFALFFFNPFLLIFFFSQLGSEQKNYF